MANGLSNAGQPIAGCNYTGSEPGTAQSTRNGHTTSRNGYARAGKRNCFPKTGYGTANAWHCVTTTGTGESESRYRAAAGNEPAEHNAGNTASLNQSKFAEHDDSAGFNTAESSAGHERSEQQRSTAVVKRE